MSPDEKPLQSLKIPALRLSGSGKGGSQGLLVVIFNFLKRLFKGEDKN